MLEVQALYSGHQHIGCEGCQSVQYIRILNRAGLHVAREVHCRAGSVGVGEQGGAVTPGFAQDGAGIGH